MRIIVLGAGDVGASLAKNLVKNHHDITLVDLHEAPLYDVQYRYDLKVIQGSGADPLCLENAGIKQADVLLAMTGNDEINLLACQIASGLSLSIQKIARVRTDYYDHYASLFLNQTLCVDVIVRPEALITKHLTQLINYPRIADLVPFFSENVWLISLKIYLKDPLNGQSIAILNQHLEPLQARVIMVFRHHRPLTLKDADTLVENDDMLCLCNQESMHAFLSAYDRWDTSQRRIMIGGGGRVGVALARHLESKHHLKLIEHHPEQALQLAKQLEKTLVLEGDICDPALLLSENIDVTDVFCAVTHSDEENIMASLLAKKLGARHAIALFNRMAYVDLISESSLDQAISPQSITLGYVLTQLYHRHIMALHRLHHNEAEALEILLEGSAQTSRVIGRQPHEIDWPHDCVLAALFRDQRLILNLETETFKTNDRLLFVLFNTNHQPLINFFL